MKMIFTADDYGVVDVIDNAVLEAIKLKLVNSVAVFPNGNNLHERVRRLKEAAEEANVDLQIGCHLTFCSGKPLTENIHYNFIKKKSGRFRPFNDQRRAKKRHEEDEINSLRNEIKAQYNQLKTVMDEYDLTIKHFTCHHNTLCWFKEYFVAYTDLANHYKLPIRSPLFIPDDQFETYKKSMGFLTWSFGSIRTGDSFTKWRKRYMRVYKEVVTLNNNIYPDVAFTDHIGPIPAWLKLRDFEMQAEFAKKQEALDNLFEKHADNHDIIEVVLHLAEYRPDRVKESRDEMRKAKYKGVNPLSVEGRMLEMKSIKEYPFPAEMQRVPWPAYAD